MYNFFLILKKKYIYIWELGVKIWLAFFSLKWALELCKQLTTKTNSIDYLGKKHWV